MNKLYRFRRCDIHCLNALFGNKIQGSKYCAMADANEVLISVNIEEIKSITKLGEEVISAAVEAIRDHVIDSYYIACFTTEDQTYDLNMWKEYAGLNGFCLVYNEALVSNAVTLSMKKGLPYYHMFKEVDYGNEPTDITPFMKDYFLLVGEDIENEDRHRFAVSKIGESLSIEERQVVTNSMFHKIGNFTEKTEKRIVSLRRNRESDYCNDMLGIPVKPIEIICSSLMPQDIFRKVKRFAAKNDIKVCIKEVNN